jgi:hypothetical protein
VKIFESRFATAVGELEAVVAARDSGRTERGFDKVCRLLPRCSAAESAAAGPRLAALLPDMPVWPRGQLAVMAGACVERGADVIACAGPIVSGTRNALEGAAWFAAQWQATGGGPAPDPDTDQPTPDVSRRIGDPDPIGTSKAVAAWWTLREWEMAAVAVLADERVRAGLEDRAQLLGLIDTIEPVHGPLTCLARALMVLDEEPLLVLHRPTRSGFRMRMSGIADNFQLHTLLGGVLIGGGHLPGEPPSHGAFAISAHAPFTKESRPATTGNFNLVAPDGTWIWNEGTPRDIPLIEGVRLLVLDPPPYQRGWPAGRFFPRMPGQLDLEGVLDPGEAAQWFARVAEPKPLGATEH